MNRQVKSKRLPRPSGREIVISDIHGDLDTYEALLANCQYTPGEDRLILLGDLVEKGPKNLDLLHKVMQQAEEENVHCIMGNCDFVAKNFLFAYRLDFIQDVLLHRPHSLIHEMAARSGMEPLSAQTDMDQWARQLRADWLKELCFLNDLPHVIETPDRIYTHAGLLDEKTYADDFRHVLTYPLFGETTQRFTKLVVVGHMPVSEYCRRLGDFNPRFHTQSNILSIDGGNQVKTSGQLNAVIFHGNYTETRFASSLPVVKALRDVRPRNSAPFFVGWNKGDITIVDARDTQSLVYSPWLRRHFWIDNSFIQKGKGTDFTNYEMPLTYGEQVEVAGFYGNKVQVKKQGILGWTYRDNLDLPPLPEEAGPMQPAAGA